MEIMNEIIYEYHHHSCINYVLRTLRVLCIYVTRCATVEMLNITWPFYRVEPFTHGDGVRVRFTGNNVICGTVQQYENNAVPRKSFIVSEPQREYCITRTLAGPFQRVSSEFYATHTITARVLYAPDGQRRVKKFIINNVIGLQREPF